MDLPNYDELAQKGLGLSLAGKQKEGISMDNFKEHMGKLNNVLRKSTECHGVVFGECIKHRDTLVNLLGWDSVEVQHFIQVLVLALNPCLVRGEEASPFIRGLLDRATLQVRYTSFVKYPAWEK